jgi:hypothetical protein
MIARMPIMISAVWALALAVGLTETAAARGEGGQRAFVSPSLGVALDYPDSWTAVEQGLDVTFKSPEGMVVHLTRIEQAAPGEKPGSDMPERLPNTRCSTSTNAYGVAALVCLDTISRTYTAGFALKPRGDDASRRFSLSAGLRVGYPIFGAMLASIRRAP